MKGYQVDTYAQLITAIASVLSGGALCILYDLLRLLRYARRPTALRAFFQDVAWWITATVVTAVIMLVRCSGEIRFFVFINMGIGFLVCRFTLSVIILKVGRRIITLIRNCWKALYGKIFYPAGRFFTKTGSKLLKKLKKFVKTVKKLLKHCSKVVYNFFESCARKTIVKRSSENDV